MDMIKNISAVIVFIAIAACRTSQTSVAPLLPEAEKQSKYIGSVTRHFDLVHTKLDVSFNWKERYLYGKAEITLHPHFYSSNELVLNARGMKLNAVEVVRSSGKKPLDYIYRNDSIFITLDRICSRDENAVIYIDY